MTSKRRSAFNESAHRAPATLRCAVCQGDVVPADLELLTVAQVAHILHLTENAIRTKIRRRQLIATRPGKKWLIRQSDLQELLRRTEFGRGAGRRGGDR